MESLILLTLRHQLQLPHKHYGSLHPSVSSVFIKCRTILWENTRTHFAVVYREIVNEVTLSWRQACGDLMLAYSIKLSRVPEVLDLSGASAFSESVIVSTLYKLPL